MNREYRLGYEIGYLSLTEASEKLDSDDLESEDPFDFLLNVLGTKRGIQSNQWKVRKLGNKGIAIETKDGKQVLITQDNSKEFLYDIKYKENNVKEYSNISPDKIVSAIHSILGDNQK